jgi:outer membrane protein OmpA-like peptidoglycan-associated protein
MSTRRLLANLLGAGALAGLCVGAPHDGHADPAAGIDANQFRPAYDTNGTFTVEAATPLPRHDLSVKMSVGYSQKPFNVAVPGVGGLGETNVDSVLKFMITAHFTMALAFTDRLQLGIDAGVYRTDTDDGYGERGLYSNLGQITPSTGLMTLRPISNIDHSGSFQDEGLAGPLDARVGLKYLLMKGTKSRLSLVGSLSAPFGEDEIFLGDAGFVFEPKVAYDLYLNTLGTSKLIFNVGARVRERTVLEAYDFADPNATEMDSQVVLDVGTEALAGVGLVIEVLPALLLSAETTFLEPLPSALSFGNCRLNDGSRCSDLDDADYFGGGGAGDRVLTAMGGFEYRATADTSLTLLAGAGLIGARGEDFRVMGGVLWQPTPAGTRVIGRGDTDNDGIPDSVDICPDEPEDRDGFQDEDGCPDLDNDGDGIIDASDACPDAPEDKDGFEDDDGCPERDNDGDGVPDVTDRCPNDTEDRDGFEDDDGCPDEDNDGDGFPDAKDQCPNEPETLNGIDDTDGCPDAKTGGPQWDPDRMSLQGSKIAFTSAKSSTLTAASKQLLTQVATKMKDDPRGIVRIESHVALSTNSTNKRVVARAKAADRKLTERRAREVFDVLVSEGVSENDLRRDSLGSSRPLQQPATDPINDRIEFIRQ